MLKGLGQPTDDRKAVVLPGLHRARVSTDDTVKLHPPEAALARPREGVTEHASCDAPTLSCWGCNVTAIRDMRAASALIGAEKIGPHDAALFLRHERLVAG